MGYSVRAESKDNPLYRRGHGGMQALLLRTAYLPCRSCQTVCPQSVSPIASNE
jgi:hypothetical protein